MFFCLVLYMWITSLSFSHMDMQVGNFMHYLSRFVAGFTIGFVRVWQISLVTLSIVPLIALAGGIYAYVGTGLIVRVRKSYVKAGEIAQEVCFPSLSSFLSLTLKKRKGDILYYYVSLSIIRTLLIYWYISTSFNVWADLMISFHDVSITFKDVSTHEPWIIFCIHVRTRNV